MSICLEVKHQPASHSSCQTCLEVAESAEMQTYQCRFAFVPYQGARAKDEGRWHFHSGREQGKLEQMTSDAGLPR